MDNEYYRVLLQIKLPSPPKFSRILGAQITDQEMGSANSKKSSHKVADLFDTPLFLADESEVKGTKSEWDSGVLCPRRIGFPTSSYLRWSEWWLKNSESNVNPPECQWSALLDVDRPSEGEVESNPSLSTLLVETNEPVITGAGLENLGNTCYLNAVLQCFMHTVPLLRGIISDTDSVQGNCDKGGFCLQCAFHELIQLSFTSTKSVVSPWKLVNNLSYFSSSFQRHQQEDAHEFLQCFLNRLESCYDSRGKDYMSSQSDNLVKQVFGGCLVSKLKCCNCGHCSNTYEPSVDLNLEIEEAQNLLTAIQSFTMVEKIEDSESKFTCEECKEQVAIEKQLAFHQVPSVATFHLKRFKNDGCKIDKHVGLPLELDLLPFTDRDKTANVELKYVLYAIVVHVGLTFSSGHYYCFIRLSPNMWYKFDDARVLQVNEDSVLSEEAYILFYAKEGTCWFTSLIRTEKLFEDLSTIPGTSPKSVLNNKNTSSFPSLEKNFSCDSIEASNATHRGVDNYETYREGSSDRISCKRQLEKGFDDLQKGEACQLSGALKGTRNEGSVSRKKFRRFESSQCNRYD